MFRKSVKIIIGLLFIFAIIIIGDDETRDYVRAKLNSLKKA